jgi:hypothetical protein
MVGYESSGISWKAWKQPGDELRYFLDLECPFHEFKVAELTLTMRSAAASRAIGAMTYSRAC